MMETKISLRHDEVIERAKLRQEPTWLMELRQQALNSVDLLELPKPDKTKITNWNFSNLKIETSEKTPEIPEHIQSLWANEKDNTIVIYKDQVIYRSMTDEFKASGITFMNLFQALEDHGTTIQAHFMQTGFLVEENKLTALHTAFLNSGIFIHVPKNVVLNDPLQVVVIQEGPESLHNHVLILAEEFSRISYVEHLLSMGEEVDERPVTSLTEIVVKDGAQVSYGAIDRLAKGNIAYVSRRAKVARDGRMEWANGVLSEGNSIIENETYLEGDGSYCDSKTVTVGRGNQIQNFTTRMIHFGKRTEGYILNHGVGMDESTTIFNGIGKIEHGASKTNAEQSSKILMLNSKARGDANPILLIDEHDVMAGHAASVGKVNENDMYYLMSRGIPRHEAERLIIHGFLAPVVNQLPIEKVRQEVVRMIERKIVQ